MPREGGARRRAGADAVFVYRRVSRLRSPCRRKQSAEDTRTAEENIKMFEQGLERYHYQIIARGVRRIVADGLFMGNAYRTGAAVRRYYGVTLKPWKYSCGLLV